MKNQKGLDDDDEEEMKKIQEDRKRVVRDGIDLR